MAEPLRVTCTIEARDPKKSTELTVTIDLASAHAACELQRLFAVASTRATITEGQATLRVTYGAREIWIISPGAHTLRELARMRRLIDVITS